MLKIRTAISIFLFLFVAVGLAYAKQKLVEPSYVRAFEYLEIELGVASGEPIFTVENMLPGDCEVREIEIENNSDAPSQVSVRSSEVLDDDGLSGQMSITIVEDDLGEIYNDSLEQFFDDSGTLDGVELFELPGDEEMDYEFMICLNETTGNDYQNTSVVFDLIFGEIITPFELPLECSALEGEILFVIEGTPGDDELDGGNFGELILGHGGDDELDGDGGNDCVVGGEGNDELDGSTGSDVLLGGEGNDELEGGPDPDRLYGGDGDDYLEGDGDDDYLDGGEGEDELDGGTDTDTCVAGEELDSCEL